LIGIKNHSSGKNVTCQRATTRLINTGNKVTLTGARTIEKQLIKRQLWGAH